jgi:hypothetical protein
MVKSTDGGLTWKASPLDFGPTKFAVNSEDDLFLGSVHCHIYRSTDDGETWEKVNEANPHDITYEIESFRFRPEFSRRYGRRARGFVLYDRRWRNLGRTPYRSMVVSRRFDWDFL